MKRIKKKLVKFLEIEEVAKFERPLLDKTKKALEKQKEEDLTATDKISIRDFAVISLVYACALRISEACHLKLNDIDLEKKSILIIDSKGEDRFVSIPEPTIKILKEWLDIRPNWKNNPYFFTNIKGTTRPGYIRPLNAKYYNQLFTRLAAYTGITLQNGKNPHPHTLRHSRAMELYDYGITLDILQAFLGHKDISTTQIYAKVRNEKVIEAQQAVTGGLVTI